MQNKPASIPIPEELQTLLAEVGKVNANYQVGRLSESVRSLIFKALSAETVDEKAPRSDKVARAIELVSIRIRARYHQILVSDGKKNPLWLQKNGGDTPQAFRASRRGIFKVAQEVLTDPADRVTGHGDSRQDVPFLQNIIIDPAKLSDHLVESLGFGHMLAPKGSSAKEKLLAKEKVIQHIKRAIFGHIEAVPFSPSIRVAAGKSCGTDKPQVLDIDSGKSQRLFRIIDGEKRGLILCAREIAGTDRFAVTNLYSAARQTHHAEKQYGEERAQLVEIDGRLDEIESQLKDRWDEAKSPAAIRETLRILNGMATSLQFVLDRDKVQLLRAIANIFRLVAEKNKQPALACISRARRMVGRRLSSPPSIMGELAEDRTVLQNHITTEERIMGKLYHAVQHQQDKPRLANPEMELPAADIPKIRARIHELIQECLHVNFQPNLPFAKKMSGHLGLTRKELQSDRPNRQLLAASFMRAYIVSKLARFNGVLLNLYEDFSVNGGAESKIDAASQRAKLAAAAEELGKRDVGENVHTPEYNKIWAASRELVKGLDTLMRYYEQANPEQRVSAVKQIKDLIKKFDLPGQVAAAGKPAEPAEKA
ncbi:hypothetical protein HZA42_01120 [Candidatus Peregrinibacteria bacterium]|nr:hypothetical protein [Candidatus Peregrinibacteria bacterium]